MALGFAFDSKGFFNHLNWHYQIWSRLPCCHSARRSPCRPPTWRKTSRCCRLGRMVPCHYFKFIHERRFDNLACQFCPKNIGWNRSWIYRDNSLLSQIPTRQIPIIRFRQKQVFKCDFCIKSTGKFRSPTAVLYLGMNVLSVRQAPFLFQRAQCCRPALSSHGYGLPLLFVNLVTVHQFINKVSDDDSNMD